jgi:ferredoxin
MAQKFWKSFVQPSTLEFIREGKRTPGYSWFDALHGYVYARWPYLYIGIGLGEHPATKRLASVIRFITAMGKAIRPQDGSGSLQPATDATIQTKSPGFAGGYHGKVMPLESVKRLVMVNENVVLRDLEKIIPYARARDIVLSNPQHILALECPCRASRPNPCLPLDVCLIIGEPFAAFVAEHHPRRSRWITQAEAINILQAEDQRGHVHHAFFKDAMLGRYYAICNCCACCCGAMQAQRRGTPMLASSGYVCKLDESLCIGCGECAESCQFGALALDGPTSRVDAGKCMGCGVCVSHCAQAALSLEREPGKGEPLEILELLQAASTEH